MPLFNIYINVQTQAKRHISFGNDNEQTFTKPRPLQSLLTTKFAVHKKLPSIR